MKNFKFKINEETYDVEINEIENNVATVQVNGKEYTVTLESQLKAPRSVSYATKPAVVTPSSDTQVKKTASGIVVKAPLPGVILEVHVKSGDAVKRGQRIMTMEAMKMHNDILAEKDGVIKTIKANACQTVMEGEVLVEMD